jgi:hypothetical protein
MIRLTRAAPLLALLASACSDDLEPARVVPEQPTVDLCSGLPPLALKAEPARVRVSGPVSLAATGGSGHYRFLLEPGGSSGELIGNRFVAGRTPATDTLVVEDAKCPGDARTSVTVLAGFGVAPARAELPPGTSFQIVVEGLLGGSATYTLTRSDSGATLTPQGVYTAGPRDGLDLLTVRDAATGDEALLRYEVRAGAKLSGDPAFLAVPSGSSVPLGTRGGTDGVTWAKEEGPGTLADGRLTVEPGATGTAVLTATDRFTKQTAQVKVSVLGELTRPGQAHGRLSDVASMVTADFDGDGLQDLAVGQRESDLGRPSGGAVFIFKGTSSGLPSAPTWVLTGTTDTAAFGDALAAGDLDGDSRAELVVSSPGADVAISNAGAVYLYTFKGGTPAPLRQQLTGLLRDAAFGAGLALADMDGDGDMDLVAGAPLGDLAPTNAIRQRGTVDLYLSEAQSPVPDLPTVRLGGSDLTREGTLVSRSGSNLGRAVVAADFNRDGRVDLAALGRISRYNDAGAVSGSQVAISVFFARPDGSRFRASPDVYILPSNTADTSEGTWRLDAVPGGDSRPPLLLAVADQLDSPDLRSSGGVQSGSDAGGALLFDLSDRTPSGDAPATPPQVKREEAFARIYGDAGGIFAGRSWAVLDVDGVEGPELLLGAPRGSGTAANNAQRWVGKVLVYPLATLSQGAVINKPQASLLGAAKSDTLGAGLTSWTLPDGPVLVAFSGRASSDQGAFTGRVELYQRAGASLTDWPRTGIPVPTKPSVERYAETLAVARGPQNRVLTLVGAPGWSGAGGNADGDALSIGRAYLHNAAQPATAVVAEEGAPSPSRAGRSVGQDVAFTDFNGDSRPDMVVGATGFYVPGTGTTAGNTELSNTYATVNAACVTSGTLSVGGVLVSLGQADGTFKPAFRLWAPTQIADCTPETDTKCRRSAIGRGVVGGFDFNNDGKEDIGVLRERGMEVFLGRAPEDASLTKLTMGCDPVYSWPSLNIQTSVPTSLEDLNGDSCDELAWRYSDGSRSGVAILFGFDKGGARCGGRTTGTVLRIAGDSEVNLSNQGLGVGIARAGRFLGDTRDFVAVSASSIPFEGVTQPVVLLYDKAVLLKEMTDRQAAGLPLVIGSLGDGVTPVTLVHRTRAVSFGASLAGGRDVTGDGIPDLVVSAPGASDASDGGGAVYLYAGGRGQEGRLSPFFMAVGDVAERSGLGQDVALLPGATGGVLPQLLIGAPRSYRTGTQNGTAFAVPLAF